MERQILNFLSLKKARRRQKKHDVCNEKWILEDSIDLSKESLCFSGLGVSLYSGNF